MAGRFSSDPGLNAETESHVKSHYKQMKTHAPLIHPLETAKAITQVCKGKGICTLCIIITIIGPFCRYMYAL